MKALSLCALVACSGGDPLKTLPDKPLAPSGAGDAAVDPGDPELDPGDPRVPTPTDTCTPLCGSDDAPAAVDNDPEPIGGDDAELVSFRLPASIGCNDTMMGAVTMRNTGTTTWTPEAEYYLGMPDMPDPFSYWNVTHRVGLFDGRSVPPGASMTFYFKMVAPAAGGPYRARYQMVHEQVAWFGEVVSRDIDVRCSGQPPPCGDIPDWRAYDDVQCPPTSANFVPVVDGAIAAIESEEPDIFDFNDALGGLSYKILVLDRYLNGVIARLRAAGYCAFVDPHDPNEIAIKQSDAYNEQIRIVRSGFYVRYGNGAYMATCEPSWY